MKIDKNISKVLILCLVLTIGFSTSVFSQPPPPEPGDNFGSSIVGSLILLLSIGSGYASWFIQDLKLKLFKKKV